VKIYTSDTDFDALHQAVDKARKNAKEVKVTRQALMNMLMDHANFIGKMKTFGETVEYPQNE
tara:strand:+ start:250 stop:435 length:186 start_codon:yes stop_codon:yes gene_type:complete